MTTQLIGYSRQTTSWTSAAAGAPAPLPPSSNSTLGTGGTRNVESATAARRRVEAALTGDLKLRELSVEEGAVFNAEIAAAVQERLAGRITGRCWPNAVSPPWLSTRTITFVEHRPDGSAVPPPRNVKRGTPDVLRSARLGVAPPVHQCPW